MNEKRTKKLYSWADFPEELLVKISKYLKYSYQVGHFRAVCTSWRAAVPRPPDKSLFIVPKYNPSKKSHRTGKYMRRFVFRLDLQEVPPSSSSSSPTSYLIAVGEQLRGDGQSQLRLLNPVTASPIPISSNLFPREINLNKFRVSILHKSSLILGADTTPHRTSKVVYLNAGHRFSGGRIRKATATLWGRKLYLLAGNRRKKVILNDLMGLRLRDQNLNKSAYHDVVNYKNKFFAIDQHRRGVMVDSSLKVRLVTNPLFLPNGNGYFRNHKSYLVKSSRDADLFLVDRYLDKSSEQTNYAEQHSATSDDDTNKPTTVRFRVYKLEEEEKCWKEVTTLNDQVIFVGDKASFWSYCVSAKDFPGCKGNLIFFRKEEDGVRRYFWDAPKHKKDYSLSGFHMTDFFWPPRS